MRKVDWETSTAPTTFPPFRIGMALYSVTDCWPEATRVSRPVLPCQRISDLGPVQDARRRSRNSLSDSVGGWAAGLR